jgi:predicted O-linked N-acetylglucosamine transferase (SPINDLY family)
MERAFEDQGLDPNQCLRTTPWLREQEFLGFLDSMDIYLDSPAFSGFTTAWQALQRGLPIITLEGAFLRQRLAAGLLRQAGVRDGIVRNRDEYQTTAARWSSMARQVSEWRIRREEFRARAVALYEDRSAVTAFADTLANALQRARTQLQRDRS